MPRHKPTPAERQETFEKAVAKLRWVHRTLPLLRGDLFLALHYPADGLPAKSKEHKIIRAKRDFRFLRDRGVKRQQALQYVAEYYGFVSDKERDKLNHAIKGERGSARKVVVKVEPVYCMPKNDCLPKKKGSR